MRNSWKGCSALLAAVLGLAAVGLAAPAATPLAGNWKVVAVSEGKEIALVIIKVEERDGKPTIRIVGPATRKEVPIEDISVEARSLHFTLRLGSVPFRLAGYAPKGEEKAKKLLGCIQPPGNAEPLILQRTDETDFAEKDAVKDSPGFADLGRLVEEKDARKQEDGLKALRKKYAGEPVALLAAEALAHTAIARGDASDKITPLAEQYLKAAGEYGREMEKHATLQLARGLLAAGKDADLAVQYAQKVEKQLTPTDPPGQQIVVLKVLAQAFSKAGKADKAKPFEERLAKLEEHLDEEFEKHAIPFKLETPPRRRRSSERVVLLELFTGAQCRPCLAADIAFDAVLKTSKSSEVVLLQYHLHVPGPDALTNTDGEKRSTYYGLEGTPTAYLDGKETAPLGGGRAGGKGSYDALRKQLDDALAKNAAASLKLDVQRTGDQIDLAAEVADLAKTGDRVRLRFALVEEMVRYPARNGQRLHHHVVRSFPGGVNGFALLEASAKKEASVNLADVKKGLDTYLTKFAKDQGFPDDSRPLDLKRLKVVAFVQDDKSKEVLQAVQVDVPEAK